MGLVLGIVIALATLPLALGALMSGSNWETGEGGSPAGAAATLCIGWVIAALLIVTHYHPLHLSW